MRWLVLAWMVLVACACACARTQRSALEKKYPPPNEVKKSDAYHLPGLTMWEVSAPSAADKTGDRFIVGVDPDGKLVEGAQLFARLAPGRAPADAARLAFDVLIGRAGGAALDPAADQRSPMFSAEEWTLVRPPEVKDGVLTFWTTRGEMHPELYRATVKLATAEVAWRSAGEVLHPPEDRIPAIREKMRSADPLEVRDAIHMVGSLEDLVPDLEALVKHADASVRSDAITALVSFRTERGKQALLDVVEHAAVPGDADHAAEVLVIYFDAPDVVARVRAKVKAAPADAFYATRKALAEHDARKR